MSKVEVFLGQKGVCTAGFGAERGVLRATMLGESRIYKISSREDQGGLYRAPGAVQFVVVWPFSAPS